MLTQAPSLGFLLVYNLAIETQSANKFSGKFTSKYTITQLANILLPIEFLYRKILNLDFKKNMLKYLEIK